MPTLVHDLLDRQALRGPDRPALRRGDREWTYDELRRRSIAYARWLSDRGVGRGDRVLIQAPHEPETVALIFAASRLGAVHVTVSDRLPSHRLAEILADSQPVLGVHAAGADPIASRVPRHLIGELPEPGPDDDGHPAPPHIPIDPISLIYTSGSTAMPKAIVSTHAQVVFVAEAIQSRLGYRPGDVVFSCLPLSFDYGLYQAFLSCLAGALLVLADADDAGPALLRRLVQHRATVLPLVPPLATSLALLLVRAGHSPVDLRLVTSSGARLDPHLAGQLRELVPGISIVPMFGLTECKRVTVGEPDEDHDYPGSCGRALPGTEIFVVDGEGRRLPPGEVGELVVRGPHVMAGYWRAPELSAQRFRSDEFGQPMLFTGDQCRLDAAGRLYFVGRKDEIYKQSGFRVSAAEIEAAAQSLPGVRLAAVLPPAGDRGAVLAISGDAQPHAVLSHLAERLEDFKVPKECHLLDDLPISVNGKVDKRVLLARLDAVRWPA